MYYPVMKNTHIQHAVQMIIPLLKPTAVQWERPDSLSVHITLLIRFKAESARDQGSAVPGRFVFYCSGVLQYFSYRPALQPFYMSCNLFFA